MRSSPIYQRDALPAGKSEAGGKIGASILVMGASFKTSPLAFREALASKVSHSPALGKALGAKEYAQLVTCNRIEIIVVTESPEKTGSAFREWLSGLEPASGFVYFHKDIKAIEHVFRVASGLDSMVVGEEQILAQVRQAGAAARSSGSSRGTLSALFDASVSVGKRTRSRLENSGDSVATRALGLALARLGRSPKNILLIGTGKTSRIAAGQLKGAKLFVATKRRSMPSLPDARVVSYSQLKRVAPTCDLIISATRHEGFLLKKGDLDGRRRRIIIDLAFPRNIDPELSIGRTELWNLESLAEEIATTSSRLEVRRAEETITLEAERFSRWLEASRRSSALSTVYRWADATRRDETAAVLRRLPSLSARDRKVIEAMGRRIVSKFLAPVTNFAKDSSPDFPQDQRLDVVQRIFEQVDK